MGQLVLVVVGAAWAAVLIPPLLRSRIENRPNSSVTDFRNQLHSLQKAMPSRAVTVRSMARPLASSPLSRPAATGRPVLRSGVRTHNGATVRSGGGPDAGRLHEVPRAQARVPEARRTRTAAPRRQSHDTLKRRRANVLFSLALIGGSSLFLAATMQVDTLYYVFGAALVALAAYVYVLGQRRQREAPRAARTARPRRVVDSSARRPRSREVHTFQHHADLDVSRELTRAPSHRRRPTPAGGAQRRPSWLEPSRQHRVVQVHRPTERWSAAV